MDMLFKQESFRYQHCIFTFHAFPEYVFSNLRPLIGALGRGEHREILESIWKKSGEMARQKGKPGNVPCQYIDAEFVDIVDSTCLLVTLPEPLSPPEAYFIAVVINGLRENYDSKIYTLEMNTNDPKRAALFCWIDKDSCHGVVGEIPAADKASFLKILNYHLAGNAVPACQGSSLAHVIQYAKISPQTKNKERNY